MQLNYHNTKLISSFYLKQGGRRSQVGEGGYVMKSQRTSKAVMIPECRYDQNSTVLSSDGS